MVLMMILDNSIDYNKTLVYYDEEYDILYDN